MSELVYGRHLGMATVFEGWIRDAADPAHAASVLEAAWEELARVEQLLSFFDPASEVARVNRLAGHQSVLVSVELAEVLADCHAWWQRTEGWFSVCRTRQTPDRLPWDTAIDLDPHGRRVRFLQPDAALEFGGYGKGYALDRVGALLAGTARGPMLLHGGTSSVLATGSWAVDVGDPFGTRRLLGLTLQDAGLSCSAVGTVGGDPPPAGCVVLADSALEAEVLSTALAAMGKSRAIDYCEGMRNQGRFPQAIGWIAPGDRVTHLEWLPGSRVPTRQDSPTEG